MNPELPAMLDDALSRGFDALVLTNAMRPMAKCKGGFAAAQRAIRRPADDPRLDRSLRRRGPRRRARPAQLEADDRRALLARAQRFSLHVASRRLIGRDRRPRSAPASPGCSASSASRSMLPIRCG